MIVKAQVAGAGRIGCARSEKDRVAGWPGEEPFAPVGILVHRVIAGAFDPDVGTLVGEKFRVGRPAASTTIEPTSIAAHNRAVRWNSE